MDSFEASSGKALILILSPDGRGNTQHDVVKDSQLSITVAADRDAGVRGANETNGTFTNDSPRRSVKCRFEGLCKPIIAAFAAKNR